MKKLLSLLCAVVLLSGCSTTSSWFGGSDCQSKLAREFAENANTTVYFAFDSSALSAEAVSALDSQIAWLKKNPKVNVVIQGYCDKRGTAEYNLALGERRADAVKQYLVSQVSALQELPLYQTVKNMLSRVTPKKLMLRAAVV